ncbi:hypothetical protein LJR220_003238 [Bradyrhizobium sp. LjRoot220]|uniref:hypothetical protein n=1 Tax=Bradyrhizobium sp. LjRoot220 TaxID=3342284 RepID=UPI003ECD734B
MFEIGIFCVILLAVCYWAVLWLMGRREDVLHGEFVEAGAPTEEPARSVFPERPVFPARPVRSAPAEPPAQTVTREEPVILAEPVIPQQPVHVSIPEQPAFRQERLESLLNSIKQDLNQLVQK